jgi:DNA-binding NtrC family response regulator
MTSELGFPGTVELSDPAVAVTRLLVVDDEPAIRSACRQVAAHFLDRLQEETGIHYRLSDASLSLLMSYDWPGNIRELENCMERACALSSGPELNLTDMPTQLQDHHRQMQARPILGAAIPDPAGDAVQTIADLEKQAILTTIDKLGGDKLLAAKLLGIGKTTLYRKLKEYGLVDGDLDSMGDGEL